MSNWYLQNGKESDVVISTKVRLARNISGFKFENKCSLKEKDDILDKIQDVYMNIGYGLRLIKMKDLDEITKISLVEKNIINEDFASANDDKLAILINNEENICIMINSENHIEIQVFSEGVSVDNLKNLAIEIDRKIESLINYSFSEKYGYLTASPIDVGTGMKISAIVHLPALTQTRNISKILRIINNFGMNVKGAYEDKIDSQGDLYVISNNQTLGISEDEISKNVQAILEKVIEQERMARKFLGTTGLELENKIYRAYGLLKYSKMLDYDECIQLLSIVKLGTDMGIIKELDDSKIKKLWLYTKTGNMQKFFGQTLDKKGESIKRSELINQIINDNNV